MFENEPNGYKKTEVDHYIKRLDADFQAILKSHNDSLENVKRNISNIAREVAVYTQEIPQYKNAIDSMRERLVNIRGWAEAASKARYFPGTDTEAVLANFITQVLLESDRIDELKPVIAVKAPVMDSDEFFEALSTTRDLTLEEAFEGFDFYDNNPYKQTAERTLAKLNKKRNKGN